MRVGIRTPHEKKQRWTLCFCRSESQFRSWVEKLVKKEIERVTKIIKLNGRNAFRSAFCLELCGPIWLYGPNSRRRQILRQIESSETHQRWKTKEAKHLYGWSQSHGIHCSHQDR
ncbi:hypothetical protein BS78_K133500 [Paspalum vaginatum]|uniref:Uncharacterized protein n=1 Tax=Paspalum vaginatum TaxID=158149 RepID=A0A9W8CCE7_9POAL|nr:hypothetical protein BS78_K133500 [Paspalum vaginatum]